MTDPVFETATICTNIARPYNFLMAGTFDTFLALYAGTFSAASPLTNLVNLNDDFNGSLVQSGFTYTLAAGVSYTLVSTSFNNATTGTYVDTITAVPEPQTLVLMLAGIGAVGFMARRRG